MLALGKGFHRALLGSTGVYLLGSALGFLVGIQLARGLDVDGYGLYGSAMAAVSLGATVAAGGLQLHATREVASSYARDESAVAAHLVEWSIRTVLMVGSGTAFSVGGYVLLVQGAEPDLAIWSMILTLLMGLLWVTGAIVRGSGAVVMGQALDVAIRPAAQSGLLLIGALALGGIEPGTAMALSSLAMLVALSIGWPRVSQARAHPNRSRPAAEAERCAWRRDSAIIGLTTVIRAADSLVPMILIGVLSTPEQAGLYRVATAVAMLSSMPTSMITVMVPPMAAGLHTQGDQQGLMRLARRSGLAILAPTLVIAAVLYILGAPILNLAFGEAFRPAHAALGVLALAPVIAAIGGIGEVLLHVSRHDRLVTCANAFSLLVSTVGVVVVADERGASGVAAVILCSGALRVLLLNMATWRLMNFNPSPLTLPSVALESRL